MKRDYKTEMYHVELELESCIIENKELRNALQFLGIDFKDSYNSEEFQKQLVYAAFKLGLLVKKV